MRRRQFLLSSSAVVTSWAQSATARVLKPESTFDLVDSTTHEIGEFTASASYLWALARPMKLRTSAEIVRFSTKTLQSIHIPLPDGFYGHLTLSGADAVSVWGAPVTRAAQRTRWEIGIDTAPIEKPDSVLHTSIQGCAFCGERLVAAFADGTVKIDPDRTASGGKTTVLNVFNSQPLDGFYPQVLAASVVAATPSTAIVVDHFRGRVASIDATAGVLRSVSQIRDSSIERALSASSRYVTGVRDASAPPEKEFRRAVTPTVVAAVCRSVPGKAWIVPSGRFPDRQLLVEADTEGSVSGRCECLLPGGKTPQDKVPMFIAADGVRVFLAYWSGRVYSYLPTA